MTTRLRIALRRIRHSAPITAADEVALLSEVRTIEALGRADFARLSKACGVKASTLELLAHEMTKATAPVLRSAVDVHQERTRSHLLLSTGLPDLDSLLGGGLGTGEVTELLGGPSTGKTQLCLLACAAQAVRADGSGVLVLDTGGCFRAERVYQLAQRLASSGRHGPRLEKAECRLRMCERLHCTTSSELPELLHALDSLNAELQRASMGTDHAMGESDGPCASAHGAAAADGAGARVVARRCWLRELRLLIVDSAFGALLADHSGETRSAGGAQQARLAALLREIASRHRIAVLFTNASQVDSRSAGGAAEVRTSFGHSWSHTADTRIVLLREGGGGFGPSMAEEGGASVRLARVTKCPLVGRPIARGTQHAAVRITFDTDGLVVGETTVLGQH
jgi:RecA/RadA recombinase